MRFSGGSGTVMTNRQSNAFDRVIERATRGVAQHTSRRSFPANITAGVFGFKEYPLFQAPESAKGVPKVDFGRPPTKQ